LSLGGAGPGFAPADPLTQVHTGPEFAQPMAAPLFARSRDWLLPGLSAVPPESVAILVENRRFIEAYLVGLSHALSASLLWRGFPGQLSGTAFRQFWDVSAYVPAPGDPGSLAESFRDARPISDWKGA